MFPLLLTNLLLLLVLSGLLWLISLALRDASIIDPCWGLGFVIVSWACWWQVGELGVAQWLLVGAVTLWGLRLSGYLAWRNAGKGEDRRYGQMREKHGDRFWWVSLWTVFWLQAVLMWLIAFPIQVALWSGGTEVPGWGWGLLAAGGGLWAVGFFFEAVGDWQMARFKADPDHRGKVMDRGLWRYTRHPNYFGDFCVWWGHYLMATAVGAAWTIFSPVLMSVLLLKVSGVTLLESDIEERRPEYARYRERTSAFFPAPPRQRGA